MQIWLFRAIAIMLPLLLLLAAEWLLRLGFATERVALFIPHPAAPAYLVTEPDITRRYFAANAARPPVKMEPGFILQDKPANSIRLVVQGGSTAAGYPFGVGASLAGMLEQRLKRTLADKHIEVVNTALSAVNSYTLLDLSDDILAVAPDAVLIYAGHNEYLGILGVGSSYLTSQSPTATLLWLKLRQLELYRSLEHGYQALLRPADTPDEKRRTVMATVARHKDIALHSERYQAGLQQFEQNMRLLLQKYQRAGVPVYLATIASNLAAQPPFNSLPPPPDQLAQLQKIAGILQQNAANSAALQQLNTLAAATTESASWHYQLGQLYLQLQQADSAKQHLTLARDLDLLRFRAPSAINDIIRRLAAEYDAVLVDAEQALAAQSEHGIIGKKMMLEHLHPSIEGYFVLADSFYQALYQQRQFGRWPKPVPAEFAWLERPILPAEEFAGQLRIAQLTADYPFQRAPKPVNFPAAQNAQQQLGRRYIDGDLDWLSMLQHSARYYQQQQDGDMLLKSLKIIADALPHDGMANLQAAQILLQAKRYGEARAYLKRSLLSAAPPAQARSLLQQLDAAKP
ncbi:SGNH/GDSL hydrolase family protein [Rheinheimera muenzenbergensis]|uniref:SGNH/GDSL hydrolase family protein n=1 Tax=Rheinheimera muenzenbergensis TaxID=1193628 RepID=A0ABU8CCF0_9GAMM